MVRAWARPAENLGSIVPGMADCEADIRPLLRERDRTWMLSHFDLWSQEEGAPA
jgi:hypothetical protein